MLRYRLCTLAAALIYAVSFGTSCGANQATAARLGPTDSLTATGEYIPRDLEDALRTLQARLHPRVLQHIRDSVPTAEDMSALHMSIGLGLRNEWGLWAGSRLAIFFNQIGIMHPDDMSGVLLTSLWRRMHGQPLRVEQQVQYHQRYWAVVAEPSSYKVAECAGELRLASTRVDLDSMPRATHFAQCDGTAEWWAYELDRGWFRPDTTMLNDLRGP